MYKRQDKILYGRRSVRAFDMERDVPDEMIDRLIDAALWAPNGGNMQPCRFLVIREKNEPGLFRGSDIPGGPVHIVIAVDTRGSRVMAQLHRGTVPPDEQLLSHRNTLLNCGAAGQDVYKRQTVFCAVFWACRPRPLPLDITTARANGTAWRISRRRSSSANTAA